MRADFIILFLNKPIYIGYFLWFAWHLVCFLLRSYNRSQLDETDCKEGATGHIKLQVKHLVDIAVFKVLQIGSNISCNYLLQFALFPNLTYRLRRNFYMHHKEMLCSM